MFAAVDGGAEHVAEVERTDVSEKQMMPARGQVGPIPREEAVGGPVSD